MKIVLDAGYCEEMCPNNAIEVNAVPEDRRNVWSLTDITEIGEIRGRIIQSKGMWGHKGYSNL